MAASAPCGGAKDAVTGVGAVINTADAKAGQFIGVVGLGGVGLSAVLASLALGAGKVIAIDLSDEKLEIAKELGVHHAVSAADKNAVDQVHKITNGGVHIAIETAGSGRALQTAYEITRRGGKTVKAVMTRPES